MNVLLPLPILLPLLAAGACIVAGRSKAFQRAIGLTTLTALVGISVAILVGVDDDGIAVVQAGGWPAPIGITLVADRLSALMLLTASIVLLAVLVYAIGQPGVERNHVGFQSVYMILAAGVSAAFLTGDLFNLFVAIEMMLTASYVLLTLGGRLEQVRSGMTYVVVSLVASVLFLVALALIYAATGTVNLADLAERVAVLPSGVRSGLAGLLLVVFGIKAALFPLYFWLPDSYPIAPSAVTAILAGLLTKVGVYAIVRTQTLMFPPDSRPATLLLVAAGATMVVGVLGAIAQDDVRRIFSFYIVSQIGYIIMGLGLFTVAGLAGAVFAIVHHIVVKTDVVPRRRPDRAHRRLEPAAPPRRDGRLRPARRRAVHAPRAEPGGHPAVLRLRRQVRAVRRHRQLGGVGDPGGRRRRQPADAVLAGQDLAGRVLGSDRRAPRRHRVAATDPTADGGADGSAGRADAADRCRRRTAVRLQRPRRRRPPRPVGLSRGGARTMRSWTYAIGLATIWVLLWGSASPANVVSGLAIGWLLVLAVPGLRRHGGRFVFRPVAIARLAWHVLVTTVTSNVMLTREVLAPTDRLRTAVIGVPLPGCSDGLLTLVNNLVALSPGTMPLELTHDPTVLYAHVLHLRDLEATRQDILRLTELAVRAFGSDAAIAAQDEHLRRAERS